jgi:hypothetical protein
LEKANPNFYAKNRKCRPLEHRHRGAVLSQIFMPRGAFLVGILKFVKFAKPPQITPQIVALKLPANLLELDRG